MVNIVKIMNVSVCCESALQREVGACELAEFTGNSRSIPTNPR